MAQFCVVIYNECFLLSVVCSKLSPLIRQTRCTKATTVCFRSFPASQELITQSE